MRKKLGIGCASIVGLVVILAIIGAATGNKTTSTPATAGDSAAVAGQAGGPSATTKPQSSGTTLRSAITST